MKVAWFREFGGPEVLAYEDATDPEPEPEPGEALVRVRAAGVNHVDLDMRAGVSRFPISFPPHPRLGVRGRGNRVARSVKLLQRGGPGLGRQPCPLRCL